MNKNYIEKETTKMKILKFIGLLILNLVTLPFYMLAFIPDIFKDSWEKSHRK